MSAPVQAILERTYDNPRRGFAKLRHEDRLVWVVELEPKHRAGSLLWIAQDSDGRWKPSGAE